MPALLVHTVGGDRFPIEVKASSDAFRQARETFQQGATQKFEDGGWVTYPGHQISKVQYLPDE